MKTTYQRMRASGKRVYRSAGRGRATGATVGQFAEAIRELAYAVKVDLLTDRITKSTKRVAGAEKRRLARMRRREQARRKRVSYYVNWGAECYRQRYGEDFKP